MTLPFNVLPSLRCHQNFPLKWVTLIRTHTYRFRLSAPPSLYSPLQQHCLKTVFYAFYLYLCSSHSFLNQLQLGFYHPTPIKRISERSPMAMPVNYFHLTWEHLTPDISCLHESLSLLGPMTSLRLGSPCSRAASSLSSLLAPPHLLNCDLVQVTWAFWVSSFMKQN